MDSLGIVVPKLVSEKKKIYIITSHHPKPDPEHVISIQNIIQISSLIFHKA